MGLMMLWTGDYRFGGFARKPDVKNSIYDHCSCDGQFSEALICRDLRPGFFAGAAISTHTGRAKNDVLVGSAGRAK